MAVAGMCRGGWLTAWVLADWSPEPTLATGRVSGAMEQVTKIGGPARCVVWAVDNPGLFDNHNA